MSETQLFYALVVPGIGHADWGTTAVGTNWALQKPLAIGDGDYRQIPGATGYVHLNLLNPASSPDHLGSSINYRTGSVDVGSISFNIISDGPAYPVLANFYSGGNANRATIGVDIGGFFATRRVDAAGLLAADISDVATTVDLWSRDGNAFAAGDVIYIEKETIFLNVENAPNVTNNTQNFTIVRACFGSEGQAHKTTPVAPNPPTLTSGYDNRVWFEKDPRNAECYVIEWNGTSLDIVWRGYLTQDPRTRDFGLTLDVEPQDALALLVRRGQNEESYGTAEGGLRVRRSPFAMFLKSLQINNTTETFGCTNASPASARAVVLQVGDKLQPVYWDPTTQTYVTRLTGGVYGTFQRPLDIMAPYTEEDYTEEPESGTEVIVVGSRATAETSTGFDWDVSSVESVQAERHHPLYAFLVYLLSSGRYEFQDADYDKWNVGIGCAIPKDMIDIAGIEALIAARPQEQIYFSVLGWGGASYSFRDIINKWLLPFRYYVHMTPDYKLTVSRLEVVRAAQATQINSSDIAEYSEEQSMGWEDTIRTVIAQASYPWEEKRTITIRDLSQGILELDPRPIDPELDLDVSCIKPSTAVTGGGQRGSLDGLLQFYRRPIPTYRFTLVPQVERLYPGQKLQLNIDTDDCPFYGANGQRVPNGEAILGIITETRMDFITGTIEVELSGINDSLVAPPKDIGPSFTVLGYDAGEGKFAFALDEFGVANQKEWADYISLRDISVEFWNPRDGKVFVGGGAITVAQIDSAAISGPNVNMVITSGGGALTTIPADGSIMRLVTWDDTFSGSDTSRAIFTYTANVDEVFSTGVAGDIFV